MCVCVWGGGLDIAKLFCSLQERERETCSQNLGAMSVEINTTAAPGEALRKHGTLTQK
jgi:hypothetical protein